MAQHEENILRKITTDVAKKVSAAPLIVKEFTPDYTVIAFGRLKDLADFTGIRKTEMSNNRFSFKCSKAQLDQIQADCRARKVNPFSVMAWEPEAVNMDHSSLVTGVM